MVSLYVYTHLSRAHTHTRACVVVSRVVVHHSSLVFRRSRRVIMARPRGEFHGRPHAHVHIICTRMHIQYAQVYINARVCTYSMQPCATSRERAAARAPFGGARSQRARRAGVDDDCRRRRWGRRCDDVLDDEEMTKVQCHRRPRASSEREEERLRSATGCHGGRWWLGWCVGSW